MDERGFVFVGVDDPTKAEPVLREIFGERHIKVEHVEQAEAFTG